MLRESSYMLEGASGGWKKSSGFVFAGSSAREKIGRSIHFMGGFGLRTTGQAIGFRFRI